LHEGVPLFVSQALPHAAQEVVLVGLVHTPPQTSWPDAQVEASVPASPPPASACPASVPPPSEPPPAPESVPPSTTLEHVEAFVSHPSVLGGVVLQSDHPGAHAEYVQVVPVHCAPALCRVSHTFWQPPQWVIDVVDVSHPLVSGGLVLQFA
jgi:hypothetical protein